MAIIDSGKTLNGKSLSYEVVENGYNIYLGGGSRPWITQPAPYDKNFVPNGTHEENALAQIEELCKGVESQNV